MPRAHHLLFLLPLLALGCGDEEADDTGTDDTGTDDTAEDTEREDTGSAPAASVHFAFAPGGALNRGMAIKLDGETLSSSLDTTLTGFDHAYYPGHDESGVSLAPGEHVLTWTHAYDWTYCLDFECTNTATDRYDEAGELTFSVEADKAYQVAVITSAGSVNEGNTPIYVSRGTSVELTNPSATDRYLYILRGPEFREGRTANFYATTGRGEGTSRTQVAPLTDAKVLIPAGTTSFRLNYTGGGFPESTMITYTLPELADGDVLPMMLYDVPTTPPAAAGVGVPIEVLPESR